MRQKKDELGTDKYWDARKQVDGKYSKPLAENQLAKMKREKPDEYAKLRTSATLMAEMELARLGYEPGPFDGVLDERTKAAIREYEKKRGIPITGDPLSYETTIQLQKDEKTLSHEAAFLSGLSVVTNFWDDGVVSARGTWTISNEKMGEPEQTSKIECYRSWGLCIESTAILQRISGSPSLFNDIDTYEIERWDEKEIVTKPKDFGGCTRYVRRINRLQESVTGIRSTVSNKDICKGVDQDEKYLVLKDGFEVYMEVKMNHGRKVRELMQFSPTVLKTLDGMK
ncbi:MAG: peptidoglycan-binding domain-containing protein [Syntrophobacteraceae bacterium]